MDVLGVRVELPTNQPIVLLRERGGRRPPPTWVGAAGAGALAPAPPGHPPRPLTHDLLADVVTALGHAVESVRITGLVDGAFHAVLVLRSSEGERVEVDSRSSDAIALALRTGATIEATEDLLAEAGIEVDDEGEGSSGTSGDDGPGPGMSEEVLAEFKEFIDSVSPEDFETDGPPAAS